MRVMMLALVMEGAIEHGIARLIHISSSSVYGIPDHHPILEDDPLQGVGPYGESKIGAQRMCLEPRASGLCVPVLRAKSFVGPERLGAPSSGCSTGRAMAATSGSSAAATIATSSSTSRRW